jgi:hypothetical protein
VKSTGFVPKGEQDVKDSPDAVAYDDPESELHGKVLAVPIPKAWRASKPVAVQLEGDIAENDSEWIVAA